MLHDLLGEIFRDSTFELLYVIWANSESFVSKDHRLSSSENKENNRGEKPDFKVITTTKRKSFLERLKQMILHHYSSLLVKKDLIKLSNFQSGALDELIKIYMATRLI